MRHRLGALIGRLVLGCGAADGSTEGTTRSTPDEAAPDEAVRGERAPDEATASGCDAASSCTALAPNDAHGTATGTWSLTGDTLHLSYTPDGASAPTREGYAIVELSDTRLRMQRTATADPCR